MPVLSAEFGTNKPAVAERDCCLIVLGSFLLPRPQRRVRVAAEDVAVPFARCAWMIFMATGRITGRYLMTLWSMARVWLARANAARDCLFCRPVVSTGPRTTPPAPGSR